MIALAAFGAGYFHVYTTMSVIEGAARLPGWAGGWDQSHYVISARAFANLDFSSSNHLYPPLYALLAAPFTSIVAYDPFAIIDALCLVGSAVLLVLLFGRLIGYPLAACFALGFLGLPDLAMALTAPLAFPSWVTLSIIFALWLLVTLLLARIIHWGLAVLLAAAFLLIPEVILPVFVQPWTSTLAIALALLALWQLMRIEQIGQSRALASFLFSATLGLLLATRPLDATAAAVLYPFWLAGLARAMRKNKGRIETGAALWHIGALTAGGAVGLAILLGSNALIHGALFSPYMSDMAQSFTWSSLARKFVSLFFDSASLYVEPAQVLLRMFPWLLAGFFAVPVCLLRGPSWLKAAALLVILSFLLYLPFDDLLPNGLYRYYNYHYFRGALWLAFMMIPAAAALLWQWLGRRTWLLAPAFAAVAVTLACLQLKIAEVPGRSGVKDEALAVQLPADREIAFVDLPGIGADRESTYFSDPGVALDDRMLAPTTEIRAVPTATGTRLVFTRLIKGGTLAMSLEGWRHERDRPPPVLGSYSYTLGFPAWLLLP